MATSWTRVQRSGPKSRLAQPPDIPKPLNVPHRNRFSIFAEGGAVHEEVTADSLEIARPQGALKPWDVSPSLYPVESLISAASRGGERISIREVPISNHFGKLTPDVPCSGPTPHWAPRPRGSLWPQHVSINLYPLHKAPHPNLAEQVFAIPELFENIFVPILQDNIKRAPTDLEKECPGALLLLRSRAVSKTFRATIDRSTLLQDLMFFNTTNKSSRTFSQNAAARFVSLGHRGGQEILKPVLTHHGINEIFLRSSFIREVFQAPSVSDAGGAGFCWCLDRIDITAHPSPIPANARSITTVHPQIEVWFRRSGLAWPFAHQCWVRPPGPYLNMRFADPCCRVILIGIIRNSYPSPNQLYRLVEAELKPGASFGEVLEWLDMWDSERYESSDVVQNILTIRP